MQSAQIDRGTVQHELQRMVTHWVGRAESWNATSSGHIEKSHAQQLWSDLLRCFGVVPERIDLFERDAVRATTGGKGYIDFFWSAVAIGEAKSPGRDLGAAHEQALDYLKGGSIAQHEWPRYVIVTDFLNFRVDRLGDAPWTVQFPLEDLPAHVDQLMFLAGQDTVTKTEQEEASIAATRIMADLYTAMVGTDADEGVGEDAPTDPEDEDVVTQQASVFLTRVLFLLYGDDAGLWEEDLFYRFVLHDTTANNLGSQLTALFQVLNRPEAKRRSVPKAMDRFPYVNGALFKDPGQIEFFTDDMREALLAACRFRWTTISPALFGSMFQMVKSKQARAEGGEHYTTEENILRTLGPLFLDDLRNEADRLIGNGSTRRKQLHSFQQRLAKLQFLDPACGSGNFLNLAYSKLREIETDIILAAREKAGEMMSTFDVTWSTAVTIDQFHGFELNWWPAKIAETAMFLVDHQANRRLASAIGDAPDRLPITITAHIHHADALEVDWKDLIPPASAGEATYVFGNPPFLGKSQRTPEQTAAMKRAWGREYSGELDYVTAWFKLSARLLAERPGAFAFVATSSIAQGVSTKHTMGSLLAQGWQLRFAHQSFNWTSEVPGRAHVHCVIAGFARKITGKRKLYRYGSGGSALPAENVENISPYLIAGPDILVSDRRSAFNKALDSKMTFGAMAADGSSKNGGSQSRPRGLLIGPDDIEDAQADDIAAKFIRPFVGAKELIGDRRRWCIWMPTVDPQAIASSPFLKTRIEHVQKFRSGPKRDPEVAAAASRPYAFMRPNKIDGPYLGIPRHFTQHRKYVTAKPLDSDVVAGDATVITEDPDGLIFAVVSSGMFIAWQRMVGGRIREDLRFAAEVTWNTFPLPPIGQTQRETISAAGRKVLEARELHPNRSLASQYDPLAMDTTLLKAHDVLDREVDKAMGAAKKLTTERQRCELLFTRYSLPASDTKTE